MIILLAMWFASSFLALYTAIEFAGACLKSKKVDALVYGTYLLAACYAFCILTEHVAKSIKV